MFEVLQNIPYSTVFIFLVAAGVSFLTTLANRLLTNPEKSKAWRKEISEWTTELRKAQRAGEKKNMEKLMKKQQYIMQLQSKMMWQSLKVTILFIVPLLLMWQILGGFYRSSTGTEINIAYLPGVGPTIPLPLIGAVASLIWWYLICSFLFSTVFSHLLGLVDISD
jgi:uncharacterized membrane protein (DUF106 family)